MLKKISLLLFLFAASLLLPAAPIPLADCNFGVSPVAGATAVGNMPISYNANNKEVIISYEPHRNKSASGGLSIPLKRVRGIALVVAIKLGANVIALVLPLAFVRPILLLAEFFRKKGD